VLDLSER